MKIAKGRPMTRRCFVCRLDKKLRAFVPGGGRICDACRDAGLYRTYAATCIQCGRAFEARSAKAKLCDAECKQKRSYALRRARTNKVTGKRRRFT